MRSEFREYGLEEDFFDGVAVDDEAGAAPAGAAAPAVTLGAAAAAAWAVGCVKGFWWWLWEPLEVPFWMCLLIVLGLWLGMAYIIAPIL